MKYISGWTNLEAYIWALMVAELGNLPGLLYAHHQDHSSTIPARSLNATICRMQDQLFCSLLSCTWASSSAPISPESPSLGYPVKVEACEVQGHLSCSHSLEASLPETHTQAETALPCSPGEVQSPISQLLQLVRDRSSSPTFMALGPAVPPAIVCMCYYRMALPSPCDSTADTRQGWLSSTHELGASSPAIPTSRNSFTVLPR